METLSKAQVIVCIIGFAVGDALGVPAEFMLREDLQANSVTGLCSGGAHGQVTGTWSDDTSMTLCTLDSLTKKRIDYTDLMQRFSDWLWKGEYTAHDEVFDVGGTTRSAIYNFVHGKSALTSGETSDWTSGNGSLMRILPVVLYLYAHGKKNLDLEAATVIHNYSKCTHANPRCLIACGIYAQIVFNVLKGQVITDAIHEGVANSLDFYQKNFDFAEYLDEFSTLTDIEQMKLDQVKSSGYVVDTLYAVLWCLLHYDNYQATILAAVNLGDDTDTIAAIAGGIAGLSYGIDAIPDDWLQALAKKDYIEQLAVKFYDSLPK